MVKEFYLMKPNTKKDDIDSKWSKTLTGLDVVFNSEHQSEVHVHNYNMYGYSNDIFNILYKFSQWAELFQKSGNDYEQNYSNF